MITFFQTHHWTKIMMSLFLQIRPPKQAIHPPNVIFSFLSVIINSSLKPVKKM